MKAEQIPVPPSARQERLEGGYVTTIYSFTNRVHTSLREGGAKSADAIYTLAPNTEWNDITRFYDDKLGTMNFSRATLAIEGSGERLATWKHDKQTIGIGYLETGTTAEGNGQKFLIVFSSES